MIGELKTKVEARKEILKKLQEAQDQITGIRANKIKDVKEKLNRFTNDKLKIDIDMIPSGDKEQFIAAFPNFLRARNLGETVLGIPDLNGMTNAGKPFYVIMIERALGL